MKRKIRNIIVCLILLNIAIIAGADEAALKNPDGSWKWTNRLSNETSPYLLLHAHNPVEWYPWGDEALTRAKAENKPIFLSVGYSTCYWCHVMERKVFSNPEIAKQMNENFINIKIDREERPDLDEIYMTATQLLLQRGGWPNSVFLTPDLKPFYAGTYFPPADMPGRPGFPTIMTLVLDAWKTREAEVIESADRITYAIELMTNRRFTTAGLGLETQLKETDKPLNRSLIAAAVAHLQETYSQADGGFGAAPKFPNPANLEFLLSEYQQTPHTEQESLLTMVTHTLDMMAYGGIYDQIGGGFHRYAVDAKWHVPHFEKMLYDNAQLAKIYLQTYQLTQEPRYRRIAEEIFGFVFREMTAPEGGFYAALDAETDAEEGKYYVWTADEIQTIFFRKGVAPENAAQFATIYGVDKGPNFEGKSVLYVPYNAAAEDALKAVKSERETLLSERFKRERPLLDTKIIVSWNGLMIDALAYGYEVLGEERYLTAASKASQFILDTLSKPNGELWHTYTAGVVKYDAYLDDYAFFVRGLLGLHKATGEDRWLQAAIPLTDKMIQHFWDDKNGGFYFTKADAKQLIVRTKKPHDSAVPSGNAVAVNNFFMLMAADAQPISEITDTNYRNYVEKTLSSFAEAMADAPASFMHMLFALNGYFNLDENGEKTAVPGLPLEEFGFGDSPQAVVTASAKMKTPTQKAQFDVVVQVKIDAGWHINANPAGQDNLIPTTITVDKENSPVEVVDVNYPKGKSVKFEFSDAALRVYEGTFTISVRLKRKPNKSLKKDGTIILKLDYQPCNETQCLLPQVLDIPLKLR